MNRISKGTNYLDYNKKQFQTFDLQFVSNLRLCVSCDSLLSTFAPRFTSLQNPCCWSHDPYFQSMKLLILVHRAQYLLKKNTQHVIWSSTTYGALHLYSTIKSLSLLCYFLLSIGICQLWILKSGYWLRLCNVFLMYFYFHFFASFDVLPLNFLVLGLM